MRHNIRATPDNVEMFRDVVASVEDRPERERHNHAVRRYREEREVAASAELDEAWWIDVGGEGEPC